MDSVNTPSRQNGVPRDEEARNRHNVAHFIQKLGDRLKVKQYCTNGAIIYMHRFYMVHSIMDFTIEEVGAGCTFLATKTYEELRKLEDVAREAVNIIRSSGRQVPFRDAIEMREKILKMESTVLAILGYNTSDVHAHLRIVEMFNEGKVPKEQARVAYLMASTSLKVSMMCVMHTPEEVACACLNKACKWTNFEMPVSMGGRGWYRHLIPSMSDATLEDLTMELSRAMTEFPQTKTVLIQDINNPTNGRRASQDTGVRECGNQNNKRKCSENSGENSPKKPRRDDSVDSNCCAGSGV